MILSKKTLLQKGGVTDVNKLSELAAVFRAAIMACDPKSLPIALQGFPRGACGDAALLLAKYLQENGCGEFDYVEGEKEGRSHAWLQRGKVIIDITADQFEDQDTPVIVTQDHSWHSGFDGQVRHVAGFCIYDPRTVDMLGAAYKRIREQIATEPGIQWAPK